MKRKLDKLLAVMFLIGSMAFLLPIFTQMKEVQEDDEQYAALREQLCASSAATSTSITAEGGTHASDDLSSADSTEMSTVLPALLAVSPTPRTNDCPLNESAAPAIDLSACISQNEDFVAWLSIPGTPISYPVVSSRDTSYYLNHLFTGEKSKLGCLFSLPSSDYQTPSKNIAIYGHHLSHSDAMFSSLLQYKGKSYCDAHPTIALNTIYGDRTYRIFAVLNMKVSDWDAATADFSSGKEFLHYVERARQKALYETAVTVDENDHILTLITCDRSYGGVSGRLIVMAVEE